MDQINMHEAKTHLSRYAKRVEAGEEIVIAKAGKPVMKLVPYVPPKQRRKLGLLRDKMPPVPDSVWFDRDEEIEALIEHGELFP
ncbi:type II toxin-antitoxin system Phd/YefM family antitoxin [bacterium]|nr:type II toxin-antitoxin system Phd/YefM family antitoxin [bacterium]